jgi:glycosyltransferase involved in cell wall biosynthesis
MLRNLGPAGPSVQIPERGLERLADAETDASIAPRQGVIADMAAVDLSIILPVYNEEKNITLLYNSIVNVIDGMDNNTEILMVDDGSTDTSFDVMALLAAQDARVRVIKFRRNYGQTAAMTAGIEFARARVLVTMDADLQNDPDDIPKLVRKLDEGYDVVVGWRQRRKDAFVTRIIPSKIANFLIGKVTGVPIKDNGCSLKAYKATVIKSVPLYAEMHRFIPAMASLVGARTFQMPVRHHERKHGVSKYGLSRIYKVLLDLIKIRMLIQFAARPYLMSAWLCVVPALISIFFVGYVYFRVVFVHESISMTFLALGLLSGVSALFLTSLGLLSQLIYKTGTVMMHDFSAVKAMSFGHDAGEMVETQS